MIKLILEIESLENNLRLDVTQLGYDATEFEKEIGATFSKYIKVKVGALSSIAKKLCEQEKGVQNDNR